MNLGPNAKNRIGRLSRVHAVALILATGVVGSACQENIQAGPTKADYSAERERLAKEVETQKVPSAAPDGSESMGADPIAGGGPVYTYLPEGRRDPFRSMLFDLKVSEDERPRAPLEQFELGQISLTGVVWSADQPRALVSDPEGRSFVVQAGSRLGKNEGEIVHIGDNTVLVKETYVNFAGDKTTKNVELRMRRTQGG